MDIVKFFYLSKGYSEKENVKQCGSNEIIAIIDGMDFLFPLPYLNKIL